MFKTKVTRRGLCALAAFFFLPFMLQPRPVLAEEPIRILMDGAYIAMPVPPAIVEDRVMVPAAAVFERAGGAVSWDGKAREVSVNLGGFIVKLTIGGETPVVNGAKTPLSPPAALINDRTMIPLRFVSEALGFEVGYHNRVVVILTEDAESLTLADCYDIIDGKPPAPKPAPKAVTVGPLTVSTPVKPNETAMASIRGEPGVEYSIAVYYNSGASKAAGLTPKTTNEDGDTAWYWRVGGRTAEGAYKVAVSDGKNTYEATFVVKR